MRNNFGTLQGFGPLFPILLHPIMSIRYINNMENIGLFNAEGNALSIDDVMAMLPTAMINRVEVIDENGRSYVNWKPTNRTELQVQDNGRTLKVFVSQGN